VICYRHCDYRTPLRSTFQAQREGARYHRGTEFEPTQYLCLHPLGPLAEALRRYNLRTPEQARRLNVRTWALDVSPDDLLEIPFADHYVSDDPEVCQELADKMRRLAVAGLIVPSAALPGTKNVVLFGARAATPYQVPVRRAIDVPSSITSERGQPLAALLALVRFRGDPHPGADYEFREPSWEVEAA